MKKAIFIIVLLIAQHSYGQNADVKSKYLSTFLYSKNVDKKSTAYNIITKSKPMYKNEILKEFMKYNKKHMQIPDNLIYLATIVRDAEYVTNLIPYINDTLYTNKNCIYSCPIVFALTIYKCFENINIDAVLQKTNSMAHDDLEKEINYVSNISLQRLMDNNTDSLTKDKIKEYIKKAGPKYDGNTRIAAAGMLKDNVNSSIYLYDLYWLLVNDFNDASCEYRNFIYQAIYMAEIAKKYGR